MWKCRTFGASPLEMTFTQGAFAALMAGDLGYDLPRLRRFFCVQKSVVAMTNLQRGKEIEDLLVGNSISRGKSKR